MGRQEKHPHIEMPSREKIKELLQEKGPGLREVYLCIHELILETLPEVRYSIDCKDGVMGYGAGQFGYDGWGMAALAAHTKWVTLMFMQGVSLEDQETLLEGTGKNMRHVKLRSPQQCIEYNGVLKNLIQEASRMKER